MSEEGSNLRRQTTKRRLLRKQKRLREIEKQIEEREEQYLRYLEEISAKTHEYIKIKKDELKNAKPWSKKKLERKLKNAEEISKLLVELETDIYSSIKTRERIRYHIRKERQQLKETIERGEVAGATIANNENKSSNNYDPSKDPSIL